MYKGIQFLFMKYNISLRPPPRSPIFAITLRIGIAAISFKMQFFNSGMVLGFAQKLYSLSSTTTKNHKHVRPETKSGPSTPPKREIGVPGAGVAKHSLIN